MDDIAQRRGFDDQNALHNRDFRIQFSFSHSKRVILHFAFLIFKVFPFGGVQRDMLRIADDCAEKGHEVTILTGSWRGEMPNSSRIHLRILATYGRLNHQRHANLITNMQLAISQKTYDLIVGFNRMAGLDVHYVADPCYIAKAYKRGWWHKLSGRYRFFKQTEAAVFGEQSSCQLLMLANQDINTYQHWYHTPISRFHILSPSIPFVRFSGISQTESRISLRREFNLPADAIVVLMVGSAFMRKGLDRAIEALAHLPPEIKKNTWLLGVGEDEPQTMLMLAKKQGVASRVMIEDGRADIAELMKGADMLIHVARSELAGIVIIEALTAGLPVLVSGICGYAEHVANANAGVVLSESFDQNVCNETLKKMLENLGGKYQHNALNYTAKLYEQFSQTQEADLLETFAQQKLKT